MTIDISVTTQPKSDQQNYDDYMNGPKTVTVSEVRVVGGEQPLELHLHEFPGRPYKPSLSMRRVLEAAWGKDGSRFVGRALTLYGDPTVTFGPQVTGGIKIEAMSHIDKPLTLRLTTTRGKRAPHTVQPLRVAPPIDPVAILKAADSIPALQAAWEAVGAAGMGGVPELVALKDARKAELSAPTPAGGQERSVNGED